MNPRRAFARALRALPIVLTAACASASHPYTAEYENLFAAPQRERRADRIQQVDLRLVGGSTVLDAVRQLRPEFLHPEARRTLFGEPAGLSVFLDMRYAGGLEMLGALPLTPVVEIRHLTSTAAKSLFGSYCRCEGGVILVRTRAEP